MKAKYLINAILILLVLPFLLGNKNIYRSTTWGKQTIYGPWEEDHVDFDESTSCADCHDDGRSRTVKPFNHDAAWIQKHGGYAWKKFGYKYGSMCYLCHSESTCARCHQQEAPENHTEFWRLRGHGAFVALDRSQCLVCHKSVDFCERCHANTRPITHNAAWAGATNNHCQNCHLPITSTGAQKCYVCHKSTPAHPF